jgi:GNAT superfamily N-acetyltransferase
MRHEANLVALRFARGCRCFAVLVDDVVGGYGWMSAGPEWIGELQLEIRPQESETYIWNCVTLAEHRRKGIFRSLVTGIAGAAGRIGMKRAWIASLAIPAENALGPAGFRPAVHFRALTVAGLHLMSVSFVESPLGRDARKVLPVRPGLHARTVAPRTH